MKFIKRFLLVILTTLLCLVAVGFILAYFYEDEIGAKVVKELSKELQVDLQVKNVELSVFSGFPDASVNLNGVRLEDINKKDLLKAKRLSFRFGLLSLFSDNIKVHKVRVENGSLSLYIDRRGQQNFDILKSTKVKEESVDASFAISLDEAELKNITLRYQDDRSKQKIKTLINNATFSGEFSDTKFSVASNSNLLLHYLRSEGEDYLQNRKVSYDAKIDVDLKAGTYDFKRVSLQVNENEFIVDGHLDVEEMHTKVDILLTSDDASLESVIQLMPEEYLDYFSDFSSRGDFDFELWIQGDYSDKEKPGIEAKFGLKNGEIRSKKLHDPLRDVSFEAKFTNGQYRNNKTTVFELNEFKGLFARKLVTMDFMIFNFDEPQIDFNLNGTLPLESIYGLIDSPMITGGSGEIRVRDLKIDGKLADMQSMSGIKKVKATGSAIFEDAALIIKKNIVSVEEGTVKLDGNTFILEEVQLTGAGSAVQLDGTFFNLLPVLFSDRRNTKKAELEFDAKLKAAKLDIGKIIALTEAEAIPSSYVNEDKRLAVNDSLQAKGVQQRERFTNLLKGKFEANIGEFIYDKIEGEGFLGRLEFDNNQMNIKGRTNAMEGILDLDGVIFFVNKPYLKAKLICNNVNLKEFFRQTGSFGQDVLTDENLDGKINSKIVIQAYFDQENNFQYDKLRVLAGIGIEDGYLKDFKMLESFSDFVKIEDLRDIKFTDLKSWLEIRNGKIFMPATFIQSNALNLELSGEYTFENDLDFNVKVNAGQILINSFKKHNKKLKPQASKKDGFFNLYYKVYGNVEKVDYEMNKREVKQDLARSQHRRSEIRVALRKEFGNLNLFEEPKDWQDVGEGDKPKERISAPKKKESTEKEGEPAYIEGF
ncbi:MAG: hypothetical protein ACI85O_003214 [Saprospiraceae bacterium]|jgi:hypothetical protein